LKVDYVEETTVRKALAFELDKETVQAEIDRQAKDLAKKARLPGFRPGKTPPNVVKSRFKSEIYSEAAEALVNKVVFEELQGRGLKPLAPPQVDELKMEEGEPMTFHDSTPSRTVPRGRATTWWWTSCGSHETTARAAATRTP
jgi:trigger factor